MQEKRLNQTFEVITGGFILIAFNINKGIVFGDRILKYFKIRDYYKELV